MSTAQYPEAKMDEDKPVPPHGAPNDAPKETPKEGPKEPLNATLKSDVPPETSPQTAPSVGPDAKTVASFERAAIEMAGRTPSSQPSEGKPAQDSKPPAKIKPEVKVSPARRDEPGKPPRPKAAFKFVDQFDLSGLPFSSAPMATPPPPAAPALKPSAIRPMFDDTFRITFTTMQSLIVAIAIGLIVLGAFGMATYSSIIAHDWSCRIGLVEKYCPAMPQPKPLLRPEIPT